jgi:transposase
VGCTTASALVSTIGDARDFKNGRQLAAWLGLVPGQYSSGGKTRLGGITKAGDGYLRTLLVLGARSVLAVARNKHDRLSRWAMALEVRRGYWKAVHRHRRQERTHGLGGARQGREIQADRGLSSSNSRHRVTTRR